MRWKGSSPLPNARVPAEKREEWWQGRDLHYKTILPPTVSAPSLTREGVKRMEFIFLKVNYIDKNTMRYHSVLITKG